MKSSNHDYDEKELRDILKPIKVGSHELYILTEAFDVKSKKSRLIELGELSKYKEDIIKILQFLWKLEGLNKKQVLKAISITIHYRKKKDLLNSKRLNKVRDELFGYLIRKELLVEDRIRESIARRYRLSKLGLKIAFGKTSILN